MLDSALSELISVLVGFTFATTLWSSTVNCASKKQPPRPVVAPHTSKAVKLKPQVIPKNEKEEMIALGQLKRNKDDYPTMDDVCSDWETEREATEVDKKRAPIRKPKTRPSATKSGTLEPRTEPSKPDEKQKTENADGDEKSKAIDPPVKRFLN